MELCIEEWRFSEGQILLRAIKQNELSTNPQAHIYLTAGDFYHQQFDCEQAQLSYRQALKRFRQLEMLDDEAITLNKIGLCLQGQAQYHEARNCYNEVLEIYRQLSDLESLGGTLSNLGSIAIDLGDWSGAKDYFSQSVDILEQTAAKNTLASAYNNLGVAYENLGDWDKTETYYLKCVDLLDEMNLAYSENGARIMVSLGTLYAHKQVWDQAINCHKWALEICQELGDANGEGTTLNHLGNVYSEQGNHDEAAECFQRSAEIFHDLENRQGEALAISNLGAIYDELGNPELAETCYRNSLGLCKDLDDHLGIARATNNLGALYKELGHVEQAISYFQVSADTYREIGNRHRQVRTLISIYSLYCKSLEFEKGSKYFQLAWEISETNGYIDHLMRLCYYKGSSGFLQRDRFKSAYEWFAEASKYAQEIGIQGFEELTQPINHHLNCMEEREQSEEAKEFCAILLEIWDTPEIRSKASHFVEKLQQIASDPKRNL